VAADGQGLLVQAGDAPAVRVLWEETVATGVAVESLEPERRSLEDVFLAALAAADAEEARHAPA
jgi:hypothetical protein